jgi:hypothetical protein
MKSILRVAVVSGLVLAIGGCSDGLEMYPVTGVVTQDRKPVEGAGVVFTPAKGPPAAGRTDAQGRYSLQTLDRPGALVGVHGVSVTKCESIGPPPAEDGSGPPRETRWHVPQRYSNPTTSNLTAEVAADKTEYNFDLTSR